MFEVSGAKNGQKIENVARTFVKFLFEYSLLWALSLWLLGLCGPLWALEDLMGLCEPLWTLWALGYVDLGTDGP